MALSNQDRNPLIELWGPEEGPPHGSPRWVWASHKAVVPYVREFLTAPHPYRPGAMCPYVPGALRSGSIYFAAGTPEADRRELLKAMRLRIEIFLKIRPVSEPSALTVLFPDAYPLEDLLRIHRNLKVWCVQRYLMVGVLSPRSEAWSIHSRDFFPLRTPVPTLVVRDMALFDTQFLIDGPYSVHQRIAFLGAYLRCFNHSRYKHRPEIQRAQELHRRYRRIKHIRDATYAIGLAGLGCITWHRYTSTKER
jgi:uncharacterized protein DUF6875